MSSASPRSAAVTGLGALTPLGPDVDALEEGLLSGRSGVRLLDEPEFADLPARLAATVDLDGRLERVQPDAERDQAGAEAREAGHEPAREGPGEDDRGRLAARQGQAASGGRLIRIDSLRPPDCSPNSVPRSYTRLNST